MSSSSAERASALKERLYVAFTSLAVIVAMRSSSHAPEADSAIRTRVLTVFGTAMAVFLAEVTGHLVAHRQPTEREQMRQVVGRSFGGMLVTVAPILCLLGSAVTLWPVRVALTMAAISLLATLSVIVYISVRRLPTPFWQKAVALTGQTSLGLLIVAIDVAVHQ